MKPAEPQPRRAVDKFARRAQHQIVSDSTRRVGGRAVDGQRQRGGGLEEQPVAAAGERDEAVEFVPAVEAASENMQRQVDLGARAPNPSAAGG